MRKPAICICENKDADQLRGNREADQRLCFRYLDSTIPLLAKSKISSFWPSPVAVQPGFCQTWTQWSESKLLVFSCRGSYYLRWACALGITVLPTCAVNEADQLSNMQNCL